MRASVRPSQRSMLFRHIWRANAWHGTETRAGPGSTLGSTARLRRFLPELLAELGASSLLDAGCSESWWMPEVPGYVGVDIVPEAIEKCRAAHPERDYRVADICTDALPHADVVLTRDVLAHLSHADVQAALANIRASGASWLLATSFEGADNTRDIRTGSYREYDLERPPFALGPAVRKIEDGYWEDELIYPTKYLGVWPCEW